MASTTNLHIAILNAIEAATQTTQFAEIAGEPPLGYDDNDIPIAGTAYDRVIAELEWGIQHAQALRTHRHEWVWADDETYSYCNVCGMSGDI